MFELLVSVEIYSEVPREGNRFEEVGDVGFLSVVVGGEEVVLVLLQILENGVVVH